MARRAPAAATTGTSKRRRRAGGRGSRAARPLSVHRFRWVFPRKATTQKGIGFGGLGSSENLNTFAYLSDDEVQSRLACEIADHPLFLIPPAERRLLLEEALRQDPAGAAFLPSDWILHGELCPKCRAIREALLAAYHGDYAALLRHVQVERFFVEPRYRSAAVTVGPQLRVDAGLHQISMDASLGALPASLQYLTLFSPYGDLVEASRGVLEYDDLLKRPLEAWKYILATCEKSTVALDNVILYLDAVFLGSSNDVQLDAFKESPDFATFKGRVELVRTPYLLSYLQEEGIYRETLRSLGAARHVAPHTGRVAALWAVLTRLRQPREEEYPKELQPLVRRLSPLDKAELYASGLPPAGTSEEEARLLRSNLATLYREGQENTPYEGRIGASPREMKTVLQNAAQDRSHPCLGPLAVLRQIHELTRDPSLYRFLQIPAEGEYLQPIAFLDGVRAHLLDLLLEELQQASGLVAPHQHEELFDRYVTHVTAWIRKEQLLNRVTGQYEPPSASLLAETEKTLGIPGNPELFRQNLIGRIGAWRLDHPDAPLNYRELFPAYLARLQESYFESHRTALAGLLGDFIKVHGEQLTLPDASRQARIEGMLQTLVQQHGYCPHCALDAAVTVLRERVG